MTITEYINDARRLKNATRKTEKYEVSPELFNVMFEVFELREPKEIIVKDRGLFSWAYYCPTCKRHITDGDDDYCPYCGQALDYGDEEL